MNITIIPILILALIFHPVPEKETMDKQLPCLILGATLHLDGSDKIKTGALTWEQGKITMVADARVIRIDLSKYQVFQMYDYHIYPLHRISSISAARLESMGIKKAKWKQTINKKNNLNEGNEASFVIFSQPIDSKVIEWKNLAKIYIKGQAFKNTFNNGTAP